MKLTSIPKKTLFLIIIVSLITFILSYTVSIWLSEYSNLNVPSVGRIKTIGLEAFWDENLENKTEAVDWELIYIGSAKNVTFYIRSISNENILLDLNSTNWNPINIRKYIHLYWNYSETPIKPREIIRVTITLSAPISVEFIEYLSTNNVTKFNFEIVISAIE